MHGAVDESVFIERLRERLEGRAITLHASGREALRVAFQHLANSSGRREIVIPAYGCYSIPAAAVAAGLDVRLVDLTLDGRIDFEAFERLPLDRVAAVVVCNLFGVPEASLQIEEHARKHGVGVVDDAAQAFGARIESSPVGSRGDVGVLSFGRGKPLSALGGGALVWKEPPSTHAGGSEPPRRWQAFMRAAAYGVARNPFVLRALSSIPALGIGTTIYEPAFEHGRMTGSALALAAALLPELERTNADRAKRAEELGHRLNSESKFMPLLAHHGESAIYPRLGIVAPSASQRDAALSALDSLGATAMYPAPLEAIGALRPHLIGDVHAPGAHAFCARLLTLPTHPGLHKQHQDEVVRICSALSR